MFLSFICTHQATDYIYSNMIYYIFIVATHDLSANCLLPKLEKAAAFLTQTRQQDSYLSSCLSSLCWLHVVTVWKCLLQEPKRHSLRPKSSYSNGQAEAQPLELQGGGHSQYLF